MSTDVVMPQMGESVAEGTIVRWSKTVGDPVERGEPLFEISTDKVDAEIPSPASGVLTEVRVHEGESVAVGTVVAVVAAAGETADTTAVQPRIGPQADTEHVDPANLQQSQDQTRPGQSLDGQPAPPLSSRKRSTPLVRRIAREHHVDIRQVQATGPSGRVTKRDILCYLSSVHRQPPADDTQPSAAQAAAPLPQVTRSGETIARSENRVERVPMSVMRQKIAEHMVLSAHTSPHVYSVYEVDVGRLTALRDLKKPAFESAGARLTFTALIARAIVEGLRHFPVINASIDGHTIVYRKDIHLGVAVALDRGLIVPVITDAGEKNLLGLSRAIEDLATRARSKTLRPEETQGGTFTLTNTGTFGGLHTLPLINQPQVAILGVGGIARRPVVVGDAIAIRPMCHLTLGYDHRLIDGADAGRFLTFVKERLEDFDEAWW